MYRFTLPRDLYYGKDALEALKTLKGKKAIIVLGGGFTGCAAAEAAATTELSSITIGTIYVSPLIITLGETP
mgnify:CR=1 FL=1